MRFRLVRDVPPAGTCATSGSSDRDFGLNPDWQGRARDRPVDGLRMREGGRRDAASGMVEEAPSSARRKTKTGRGLSPGLPRHPAAFRLTVRSWLSATKSLCEEELVGIGGHSVVPTTVDENTGDI